MVEGNPTPGLYPLAPGFPRRIEPEPTVEDLQNLQAKLRKERERNRNMPTMVEGNSAPSNPPPRPQASAQSHRRIEPEPTIEELQATLRREHEEKEVRIRNSRV
jgi:hypothetical protein